MVDAKTLQVIEKQASKAIFALRNRMQKEFDKWMKRADKAENPEKKSRHFNRALDYVRRSEAIISEIEMQVGAIKNPWHATKPKAESAKKKRT